MTIEDRNRISKHLWFLWVLALVLRITYLILAVSHLGVERLGTFAPDSQVYMSVARQILGGDPMGNYSILRVGPGYGMVIAGIQSLVGANPLYVIGLNVLMGSLAPVMIYLLAFYLTRVRIVALVAGLISATSLTSVTLSCNILTDQPSFTLHVASLVCLTLGLSDGRKRWFVASGLLAGAALLIRSTTQFWPLLLLIIPFVIPVPKRFSSRMAMLGHVGLTAGIMLLLILAWSYRNYVRYDTLVFGSNGALTIRSCLGARAIAENTGEDDILDLRRRWEAEDGDRSDEYVEAYHRARARFSQIFADHPGWVITAYLKTVWSNIRTGNYLPLDQIPSLQWFWRRLIRIQENCLGILVIVAALAGMVYLFLDKNYLSAVLLGLTLMYFTFLAGFSFWQGSRIYFPAEMAWSILGAYAGYRLWTDLLRLKSRRRMPE